MAGRRVLRASAVVAMVLISCAAAEAGGIAVGEHGRGLGNANAGGAAAAEDASTIWWNPAGLTRIRRHQLVGAAYYARPTSESNTLGTTAGNIPTGGRTGIDGGEDVVVPSLFLAYSINDCWKLGLGINAPYALVTDYGRTWTGRYYADRSEITTININPSVATRVGKGWSIGGGVDIQYVHASLSNALDLGTISMGGVGPPAGADGYADVEGDNWGVGFNVGVLFEPSACWRFGFHYRSQIEHTLEGEADFTGHPGLAPAFTDTGAEVELTLPDTVSLSGYHQINRKWAVMADATWTNWTDFDRAVISFDNPAQPDTTLEFDWNDAWRLSIGATFSPNDRWTFRTGIAWDQSPIPDSTRTPRIPGDDRWWVAFGIGYRLSRCVQLDLSYVHVFLKDGKIDQTVANPNNLPRGSLRGENETAIDILGLQLTWDF